MDTNNIYDKVIGIIDQDRQDLLDLCMLLGNTHDYHGEEMEVAGVTANWLKENGGISSNEMLRTFNCGIGLILVVEKEDATLACKTLEELGEKFFVVGEIVEGHRGVVIG